MSEKSDECECPICNEKVKDEEEIDIYQLEMCKKCVRRWAASPVVLKALQKAVILLRVAPPTVREIIQAGDEAIDAAGLNPWCINEGLATGDEEIDIWAIEAAMKEGGE